MADLEWTVDNGVGTITLNRPGRKNAFTFAMVDTWSRILREVQLDDSVRAVVLTGAPGAFCSGVDLDSISNADSALTPLERKNQLHERIHQVAYAMEALDKPVIAAVGGAAVGAGMDMALMCDLRVVARSARFSEGYVRVGLVPGDGGAYYLPRLVGTAKALELLLTGDFVDGAEAYRIGLANIFVEDDELMERTYELAHKIAAGPPVTVRTIKRLTYQSARADLHTALDLASSHFAVVAATADAAEALDAFRNQRTPVFEGR